jgi:hypothetical protein
MSIRDYPGRPIPHLKKARKPAKMSGGMGIGALIFLIVLIGTFIAASYIIPPLLNDMVFPDIGIPYPTLFLIIIGIVILASIRLMVNGGMFVGERIGFRERNPSLCTKVIKDGIDGKDVLISGSREMTFGQACRSDWPFQSADQKSKWFIKDEHGNDVTDQSLESVDGVFILISDYSSGIQKEEYDKSDEYSSIHDSVTYYD